MKKKLKIRKKALWFLIITTILIILLLVIVSPFLIFNIKLIGDKHLILNYGDKYNESGYKLKVFDKDLTNDIKVKNNIKEDIGTYKVMYTYKFLFYNISTTRKVEVKDIKGPKIELVGGKKIDVVINESYEELGFEAIDNKDGVLTEKVKVTGEVDITNLGEYKIIYEVVDSSGNKSKIERTVNVVRKNPSQMSISEYSLDGWYDEVKLTETENKGNDYFDSIIIVGDSNIKNMYEYGHLKGTNAWAIPCLHSESMHYQEINLYGYGKMMTLIDAVNTYKPQKLILNFGSFSSLWISEETFVTKASEMIEKIKEVSPETQLVLISIYPVTQYGINNDHFSQTAINNCNFKILELANKYSLKYLDVQTILKDSTGYGNPSYYIRDGFHLTSYGQSLVKEYIKTHAF